MNSNQESNLNNSLNINNNNNKIFIEKVTKLVMFVLLIIALIKLVMIKFEYDDDSYKIAKNERNINMVTIDINKKTVDRKITSQEKFILKQPTCPKSYLLVILKEICSELFIKHELLCLPGEFYNRRKHKLGTIFQKQSQKEPKVPTIINYAVGGLLVISVCAALLELYKAKKQDPNKNAKNPLSRKCSLADLTVLKHHRKELIRRESIMEVLGEERGHIKQMGRKVSRPPLRLD